MFADGGDFLAGEFAGLFENGVGDTELADVVEKAGAAKTSQILVGKSEGAANVHGGIGDTVGMLIGKRRFASMISAKATQMLSIVFSSAVRRRSSGSMASTSAFRSSFSRSSQSVPLRQSETVAFTIRGSSRR